MTDERKQLNVRLSDPADANLKGVLAELQSILGRDSSNTEAVEFGLACAMRLLPGIRAAADPPADVVRKLLSRNQPPRRGRPPAPEPRRRKKP